MAVVAVSPNNPKQIYGYYTLSAGQVYGDQLPETIKSKLPKYPIPIARIGRLAVDANYKGRGIGEFLLHDAFTKILDIAEAMGIFAVVVDAKNDDAKAFYTKYGFMELQDSGLILFLTINTINSAR